MSAETVGTLFLLVFIMILSLAVYIFVAVLNVVANQVRITNKIILKMFKSKLDKSKYK